VEFEGKYFRVPRSIIGPKPVQKPHPPIYLAAFVPAALQRLVRSANGWNPVGIPLAGIRQMFEQVKEMARAVGRDPLTVELVVRANLEVTAEPITGERPSFSGTLGQIRDDIKSCRTMGVNELILDPTFAPGAQELSRWLELMEMFAATVSLASPRR
jgi:alkanesulfonate monooxygenase SsuD/methylene tetrahydromethanopterin reductase-like flavin-dependent oxidoreductase (luciferase family)